MLVCPALFDERVKEVILNSQIFRDRVHGEVSQHNT